LILTFGPISGAHFNPAVTLADASQGGLAWREVPIYIAAQISGAFAGVAAAHLMFGEPVFFASRHVRAGGAQLFSEFVATFGLLSISGVALGFALQRCRLRWAPTSLELTGLRPRPRLPILPSRWPAPRPTHSRASGRPTRRGSSSHNSPGRWPQRCFPGGWCHRFRRMLLTSSLLTLKKKLLMPVKNRILILCTGNSARSQMAEGLLRHDTAERLEVFRAGTKPSHLRPEAIAVMRELGIDISGHRSRSVDEFTGQQFDYVLTVCDNAKESGPIFPGKTITIHRNFEDPAVAEGTEEERIAVFRRVRCVFRSKWATDSGE
jgi:arsenate reductase